MSNYFFQGMFKLFLFTNITDIVKTWWCSSNNESFPRLKVETTLLLEFYPVSEGLLQVHLLVQLAP